MAMMPGPRTTPYEVAIDLLADSLRQVDVIGHDDAPDIVEHVVADYLNLPPSLRAIVRGMLQE